MHKDGAIGEVAMRGLVLGLALVLAVGPASARLWKPTPFQLAADYATITHNKGTDGRVIVSWLASPVMPGPVMSPVLDKYVVISIARSRQMPGGLTTWDDVEGVQVSDGSGQPLKELTGDAVPPVLVGLTASAEAVMRQSTQGRGKVHWGIYEAGAVNACGPGKLIVNYDGESYTYDTPIPGCAKN
jgi:hypothetical protein